MTNLFTENFDGDFGNGINGWSVGDENSSGITSYWAAVDSSFGGEGVVSGTNKAYVSGYGYDGSIAEPKYRDNMHAFMRRSVNLTGYSSASVSFYYKMPSIDENFDYGYVRIDGTPIASYSSVVADWTYVTLPLDSYVGRTVSIDWYFDSDPSVTREGWYVDSISIDASSAVCYSLTTNISPAGYGTVNASPSPNCPGDSTRYLENTTVQLTASPTGGHYWWKWSGDLTGTETLKNITMTGNKTVTANFADCFTLTNTANPSAGGTITANPTPNCTGGKYIPNTSVQLTANANSGYTFANWVVNSGVPTTSNPVTVVMDADNRTAIASFTVIPTCFTLTTNISPSGWGAVSPNPAPNCENGTKYTTGTVVSLTPGALNGHYWWKWTGDLSGYSVPGIITMSADHTVTANFADCFSLTTSSSPTAAGSVNVNPATNCTGGKYIPNTSLTITPVPSAGYSFSSWTINGSAGGSANPLTLVMTSTPQTVVANFTFTSSCYSLTLGNTPSGWGTAAATPSPDCPIDSSKYLSGTVVQITATPVASHYFWKWTGSQTSYTNPILVTMNGNKSYTANYADCFSLTTSASPSNGGVVVANPAPNCTGGKYIPNTVVQLTPQPNANFAFSSWTVNGSAGGTTVPYSLTMNADSQVVVANFSFTSYCYSLTLGVTPPTWGSISADVAPNCPIDSSKYLVGTVVQLTGNAVSPHYFWKWTGDLSSYSNPASVTMSVSKSITANFSDCFSLSLSADPAEDGSVTANPAPNCSDKYIPNTAVEITPHPNYGYGFSNWTINGSAGGSANPLTWNMNNDNQTVKANFYSLPPCYTLTGNVVPSGFGNITADPLPNCSWDSTKYATGTVVTVTAEPYSPHYFWNWGGDLSGINPIGQLTMSANHNVIANFADCFSLAVNSSPAAGGTVTPNPAPNCTGGKYIPNTSVQLTAAHNLGFVFTDWLVNGALGGTDNPLTLVMSADNQTATAEFTFVSTCQTLTMQNTPDGWGTVTPSVAPNCPIDSGKYITGTQMQLTASALDTHYFWKWTGSLTGVTNPSPLTMDTDKNIIANYANCFSLNTSASPSNGGSLTNEPAPNCTGGKYIPNTNVKITAAPALGFAFAGWQVNGAPAGSTNPYTINMNADNQTVVGSFDFVSTCYSLNLNNIPDGWGSIQADPAPTCPVDSSKYLTGTVVQLTANPLSPHYFWKWTEDLSGYSNTTSITVSADRTVAANYADCFSVDVTSSPSNGGTVNVTPQPNCTGGKYIPNTPLQLTVTPNPGFAFTGWTINGASGGADNPLNYTLHDDAQTIVANFAFVSTCYTLTTTNSPSGWGSVEASPGPNCPINPSKYLSGTVVQLTGVAVSPHYWWKWGGDLAGISNPSNITMTGDHTVIATYADCFSVVTGTSPSNGGSVSANPAPNCASTKYIPNTILQLTATPNYGFSFTGWTVNGSPDGTNNPLYLTISDDNQSAVAGFNFVAQCYTLTTSSQPTGSGLVSVNLQPNCPVDSSKYLGGTVVGLSATANSPYYWWKWDGDLSGSLNPINITLNANKNIIGRFAGCFNLSLTSNPANGGSITPTAQNCPGGGYIPNTSVQLTAHPNTGFALIKWTINGVDDGQNNPTTVVMNDDNRSAVANFDFVSSCYTLTLDNLPVDGGATEASPAPNCPVDNTKYLVGTQVQITANPLAPYYWWKWTGNLSSHANPTNVTIDGNKTIHANYAGCFSLTTSSNPANGGAVTVSPEPNCGMDQYIPNTVLEFTATPAPGYDLAGWTVNGTPGESSLTFSTAIGEDNLNVIANFSRTYGPGDVNCDKAVNIIDSMFEYQYAAGKRAGVSVCPPPAGALFIDNCDVDDDGNCTTADAGILLQCDAGVQNAFCPFASPPNQVLNTLAQFLSRVVYLGTDQALPIPTNLLSLISGGKGPGNSKEVQQILPAVVGIIDDPENPYTIHPLQEITVPLTATLPAGERVGGGTVEVAYNPSLLEGLDCTMDPGHVFDASLCNPIYRNDGDYPSIIRVNFVSNDGLGGEVHLADLKFTSKGVTGMRVLEVFTVHFVDPDGNAIPVTDQDGHINVTTFDGKVFLPDITNNYPPRYNISGRITETGGGSGYGFTVTCGQFSAATDGNGYYTIQKVLQGSCDLTPSREGFTFNPLKRSITITNQDLTGQDFTATRIVSPTPNACSEGLDNTSFESDSAWSFPLTPVTAAYTTEMARTGSRSARVGITGGSNVASYSSTLQKVTIPSTAYKVTLRFWLYPKATGSSSPGLNFPLDPLHLLDSEVSAYNDMQFVYIYDESISTPLAKLVEDRSNASTWVSYSFDLTSLKGQTVWVYFGVYNNGSSGTAGMYVDDVELEVCK